ncbi:Transmembrane and coiled-coil domains-containing protein 3 [Apophysomyces sp. BC1034]|nr:Transmembrane and coiled-coil domains-containing protein 3 [Apophysomyces sp. BC1015]KAG0179137.1 Transmembrane and coiled-coil domains-containing protein 3 [Apophysomyces sp. BC1021]KAG0189799.1 Transmembrane and coiled-coil domains-containing protein 3 [Apophysomyces sp. BC1034]
MRFPFLLAILTCCLALGTRGVYSDRLSFLPDDANELFDILQQGQTHLQQLQLEQRRLQKSIDAYVTIHDAGLYRLAGIKVDDFLAFETLVFGMVNVYADTVRNHSSSYDFRTPALKLTFDFQLAIKESHQRLRTNALDNLGNDFATPQPLSTNTLAAPHEHIPGDTLVDSRETMQQMLHEMLQEVRENADQLEEGMQQHNLAFASGDHASIETVLKVGEDNSKGEQGSDESRVTLIDQDNNEYIMTRPSDTTVIYEDMQLLHDLILILVLSFVFGWLFSIIGLPAFFGYILAGILAGPSGYNLIKELIQTETLAQLGVVLIVFVLGVEFSLEKIQAMWRLALGGAVMILMVTVVFFVLMGAALGATAKESIFLGMCISLSSTAVVVKCIKLDHLEHLYGLLVMQDVILGFMLAVIPALAKSGIQVFFAILKIALSFAIFGLVCYAIARLLPVLPRAIRRMFPKKSIQQNHELMLLGTIAICMGMLVISEYLGLGMELGCFAAGVIVRSRKQMFEHAHVVIEPVRDLFACLFFASIGLHVYPSFLASEAVLLFTLAAAVIGFKYVVTSIVLVFFKIDLKKSSTMAVALAQISEFGFILASRAKQLNIITREVYYLLLGVTALTLMATPLLWKLTDRRSSLTHLPKDPESHDMNVVCIPSEEGDKYA